MSAQIQLLQTSMALKPGQAISIDHLAIMDAARGELLGLDWMAGVRESDIKDFIQKIERNWGVKMTQNPVTQQWTMYKPTEAPGNE